MFNSIKSFTTPQKCFVLFVCFIFLFISYCISICLLIIKNIPNTTTTGIKKIVKNYDFIVANYSLDLPIIAYKKGFFLQFFGYYLITLLFIIILISILIFILQNNKNDLYGSARWSSLIEAKKANLLGSKGIVVGLYQNKILKFDSQEFVSLGAPTRSGKGTGIVIPNLLEWSNSLVVLDVKKECFDYTSKYRQDILKQKVFIFNPFSNQTHRYNPLLYLDFSSDGIELQIQDLAMSLYPVTGGKDFFTIQAQTIFVAIVYLFGILSKLKILAKSFTLTTIADSLNGVLIKISNEKEKLLSINEAVELLNSYSLLSETIYSRFQSFFAQAEAKDQFTGVKSSFETPLNIFKDAMFEQAMSVNDFDFRDLRKQKISIYLAIPPENITTARPILNLFFCQLLFENIRQGLPDQNKELKHGVLLLMDEFTSIGYMQQYQVAVSYMAGYNLRSLIIYQNDTQLKENQPLGYGDKGAETLLENHTCNIIYRPKNPNTADNISKRIGNITIKNTNKSYNSKEVSHSQQNVSRALILPQEIMDLKDNEEIIFCNKIKLKAQKANYFSVKYFVDKMKLVSPTLKSKKFPNKNDYNIAVQRGELSIELPTYKKTNNIQEQGFFK